jgi:hypothetical protein
MATLSNGKEYVSNAFRETGAYAKKAGRIIANEAKTWGSALKELARENIPVYSDAEELGAIYTSLKKNMPDSSRWQKASKFMGENKRKIAKTAIRAASWVPGAIVSYGIWRTANHPATVDTLKTNELPDVAGLSFYTFDLFVNALTNYRGGSALPPVDKNPLNPTYGKYMIGNKRPATHDFWDGSNKTLNDTKIGLIVPPLVSRGIGEAIIQVGERAYDYFKKK